MADVKRRDCKIADRSFAGILLPKETVDGADGGITELRGEELRRKRAASLRLLGGGAALIADALED